MGESIRLVVPSRKRVRNMDRITQLLPGATVFVHESEHDDYKDACDGCELVTHSIDTGLVDVRNAILDRFDEECIVMVDDDLRGVRPMVGHKSKLITLPEVLRHVIDNNHACAQDLDVGVFCWARTANPVSAKPSQYPFRFVYPVASTFGVRGSARTRKFDNTFPGRADYDYSLRCMLEDRIVLTDMRWYFDHGRIFSGVGGNSGRITSEQAANAHVALIKRWGVYTGSAQTGKSKGKKNRFSTPMSIAVTRRNPLAVNL